ncbi:nicotinate-nucleotide--dimethylbenzimidazole phosphoribosyltransferase [Flavihumibacter solisilvae]|uniref:nicotinate-nucleotide--dimethylbenzimidazole phosphoribosyltransferase n=1 Tax=Flavihumibacter solisilvae TaxID=1349421 RepID=UPI00068D4C4F|nr:nicotinate-nucleotide--dimethylbenzimidazole phosphoribosyltransferase [Flavihumibacter solisilvae]
MKDLRSALQQRISNKIKPVGSLGLLEEIAIKVGLIQGRPDPAIVNPCIVLFAGDHGITASGLVNPYPAAITGSMMEHFVNGDATINVLCRQHNISFKVVDAGVNADLGHLKNTACFIDARIAPGTRDYREGPAMTFEEMERAIAIGKHLVESIAKSGSNTIGFGEMGIGNSSSAALIMSAITHEPLEKCTGRGTGANDVQLAIKLQTLRQVMQQHESVVQLKSPLKTLQYFGGYEIAMMTGAYLAAAENNMVIVVDGFISTAALLIAHAVQPSVIDNCIFAHVSGEQGHHRMLHYLKVRPLLQLGMRLGEGTGAALAIPLIQSAVLVLNELGEMQHPAVTVS